MNRKHWLEHQIKTNNWKKGVELGVLRGPTFKHLSTCNKEYTHYGVDVFVNDRHWRSHNITTTEEILNVPAVEWYEELKEFAKENNSVLIRDFSHLAASKFEDEEAQFPPDRAVGRERLHGDRGGNHVPAAGARLIGRIPRHGHCA